MNPGEPEQELQVTKTRSNEWTVLTAAKLREMRAAAGLTRKALADLINKSAGSIQNWEADTSRPDEASQQKLLEILSAAPKLPAAADGAPVKPAARRGRPPKAAGAKVAKRGPKGRKQKNGDDLMLATAQIVSALIAANKLGPDGYLVEIERVRSALMLV